jgi:hypothetical protein
MSIEQRLDSIITDLRQATRQQTQANLHGLLEEICKNIEASLATLSNRRPLVQLINEEIKSASRTRGCCDLSTVGGHSHSRHESVTLLTPWSRFRAGQRLSMPATLAAGLRTMNFAK